MAIPLVADDNPCRPRHFKPPAPCAPVVTDAKASELIETCRSRLVAAAALFAVVFVVVALRLVEIVAFALQLFDSGGIATIAACLLAAGRSRHARSHWMTR